jgi:hypothetical protein
MDVKKEYITKIGALEVECTICKGWTGSLSDYLAEHTNSCSNSKKQKVSRNPLKYSVIGTHILLSIPSEKLDTPIQSIPVELGSGRFSLLISGNSTTKCHSIHLLHCSDSPEAVHVSFRLCIRGSSPELDWYSSVFSGSLDPGNSVGMETLKSTDLKSTKYLIARKVSSDATSSGPSSSSSSSQSYQSTEVLYLNLVAFIDIHEANDNDN